MTTVNKEPGERVLTLGKKGQTMELECPLTPEHLHALERQIADVSQETFRIEEEKKLAVQPLNERLKEAKAREKDLLERRHKGVMLSKVPVETRANTFRREKWVVRLDTGEEVPDTRRALTDEDLQALLPGVVLEGDNRPDAPVLNLFGARPDAEPKADARPWQQRLAEPYADWSLSELAYDGGGRLYMVTKGSDENPSRAWGPFGYTWSEGFHPPGEPAGTLGDDVRASMAEALGLEAQYDVNEQGKTEPHETQAFENFLSTLESLANERASALKAESLPPAPDGGLKLYEASGHPGWAGYVYEGQFFLRPPNVDRFEPPRSPKDKGPLEWDADEERFDGVKGANVTSDWLTEQDKLLAEFDFLKKTGKITEPVNELRLATGASSATIAEDGAEVGVESPSAEPPKERGEDESGDVLAPGLAAYVRGDGELQDVLVLAAKLTANGRKLLKALVTSGPNTSSRLGTMTGCGKPGSALKHLQKDGLVTFSASAAGDFWDITDLGRKVYEQATK